MTSVSVVVPTHGRRDLLRRTLDRLAVQTLPSDRFEVIVGVDGSRDGTVEMLASYGAPYRLEWLTAHGRGSAAARNAALSRASGEVVVMLDDDMEPAPGLLAAHLREHANGEPRCVLGPAPIRVAAEDPPSRQYVARKFNAHLRELADPGHAFVLRDFYTGNVSLPRALLLATGAFDEDFQDYGNEDLELAQRLIGRGARLAFAPAAVAWQHYDKTPEALARDSMAKGRTAVLLCAKHPEALAGIRLGSAQAGLPTLRGALLALTRMWPRVPSVVIAATAWIERRGPRRLDLYYSVVLDYLYWAGAHEVLARHPSVARALRGAES